MEKPPENPDRKHLVRNAMKKISAHLPKSEAALNRKLSEYEEEITRLQENLKILQGQADTFFADLEQVRGELGLWRRKYRAASEEVTDAHHRNERLVQVLEETRRQIATLRTEIDRLCAPPHSYALFLHPNPDGTLTIDLAGRKLKVQATPTLPLDTLAPGQEVLLNEALNAIAVATYPPSGPVAHLLGTLDGERLVVSGLGEEPLVVERSGALQGVLLQVGDWIRLDRSQRYGLERLPWSKGDAVLLEEVPEVSYADIGGLAAQIEAIRDGLELPYRYPEEFRAHQLSAPKGILLYGPPGCGKTMLAKAIAHSLAQAGAAAGGGYFFNVKGPELLNKYVGETEGAIRAIFAQAKAKATAERPVVIFFDEMDALFRGRGSGISSDIETTVVAQLLAELDGLEEVRHVVVVGASNRQELIDPAVLRPGRLDVKIRVDRPDRGAAREIVGKYLTGAVPVGESEVEAAGSEAAACGALIEAVVEALYGERAETVVAEVVYARGERGLVHVKGVVSGALLAEVVRRAKLRAVKRVIVGGERGVTRGDVREAVAEAVAEAAVEVPPVSAGEEWATLGGRPGERVVSVRLRGAGKRTEPQERRIETMPTGQYL